MDSRSTRCSSTKGRLFVVLIAASAYVIALKVPPGIFGLAVQYAFSGFASLLPLLVAALFWRGSTKWGALAVVIWTDATMAGVALLQAVIPAPPPGVTIPVWTVGGAEIITRTPGGTALTPLYVKTLVQAACTISWRARKSVMTRW